MKIKKLISALVLGSMLVGLSGCNITDFSAENLLRPPKAVGDEAEIEQLIAKTADSGYTLKYPKNGKFRSAIIMTDLDGNDSNEAVAFFATVPKLLRFICLSCTQRTIRGRLRQTISLKPPILTALTLRI